jgi:hypothetical protein
MVVRLGSVRVLGFKGGLRGGLVVVVIPRRALNRNLDRITNPDIIQGRDTSRNLDRIRGRDRSRNLDSITNPDRFRGRDNLDRIGVWNVDRVQIQPVRNLGDGHLGPIACDFEHGE